MALAVCLGNPQLGERRTLSRGQAFHSVDACVRCNTYCEYFNESHDRIENRVGPDKNMYTVVEGAPSVHHKNSNILQ